MSFEAMAWAAHVKTNTPTQKLILLLLANRADPEGICYPSMKTIAEDACVTRSCVVENVKKLASMGYISVTKRTIIDEETGKNRNTSNLYLMNMEVVNEDGHPSQRKRLGVVNENDHPSQRKRLGVVNEDDNKLSIETINETIYVESDDSPELQKQKEQSQSKPKAEGRKSVKRNAPPAISEVEQYAAEYAKKRNKHPQQYVDKAREAFRFYESNMKTLGASTWKDGNGNPVKSWKLKIVNNWFSKIQDVSVPKEDKVWL